MGDVHCMYISHVHAVLQKVLKNHLYIKLEKWEFHQKTVHFLIYILKQRVVDNNLQ